MVTDLYEQLKTAARELLDKSSELTLQLDSQYKSKASDQEVRKYIGLVQIHTEGFRELLKEAQQMPDSAATIRNFASKLDGYLSMTMLSANKLIEISKSDPTATSIANSFSDMRQLAAKFVKEAYHMTDVNAVNRVEITNTTAVVSHLTTPDIFFWLTASGANPDTVLLSAKLMDGPLNNITDQKDLIDLTVTKLLGDWDNGIAFIKELADEAEDGNDQRKVSIALSLLVFTRNQLRTLYNNLAITVQRLEQRAIA